MVEITISHCPTYSEQEAHMRLQYLAVKCYVVGLSRVPNLVTGYQSGGTTDPYPSHPYNFLTINQMIIDDTESVVLCSICVALLMYEGMSNEALEH